MQTEYKSPDPILVWRYAKFPSYFIHYANQPLKGAELFSEELFFLKRGLLE